MLEIRYNKTTKQVMGWNSDPSVVGNLQPRNSDEAMTILNVGIPTVVSDVYFIDLAQGKVFPNPTYTPPVVIDLKTVVDQLKTDLATLQAKVTTLEGKVPK
jgi:hypothetical protein